MDLQAEEPLSVVPSSLSDDTGRQVLESGHFLGNVVDIPGMVLVTSSASRGQNRSISLQEYTMQI